MNKIPDISIIVPIYNVEKYIHRCINSVLCQTLTNFELILVNDGSPDNCGKICDEYAKQDSRVKVIHKENGGLSSARNAGLNIAIGKYIGFIDSDDWIEADMYEILYHNMCQYNADISMCKYKVERIDDIKIYSSIKKTDVIIINKKQALKTMLDNKRFDLTQFACDKLYKSALFDGIRYPEGKLYEDVATTYKLIDKIETLVYNDSTKYHYTQNIDSITQSKFTLKQLDLVESRLELYSFIKVKYPDLENEALSQYIAANISMIKKMIESQCIHKDIFEKCRIEIRKNMWIYLKKSPQRIKVKVFAIIISYLPIKVLYSVLA